jgi:hypothetical protein
VASVLGGSTRYVLPISVQLMLRESQISDKRELRAFISARAALDPTTEPSDPVLPEGKQINARGSAPNGSISHVQLNRRPEISSYMALSEIPARKVNPIDNPAKSRPT